MSIFNFERPEDSPGFLLWQTTILWQRLIKKAIDPHRISHSQFVIMAICLWLDENRKPILQSNIIRLSKLDKMTVSKSLKSLIVDGYVKRNEDKYDTRAKVIKLTSKGKALAARLVPAVEHIDAAFFGNIKRSEGKNLMRLLSQLVASCESIG